ncbi:MAG: DUF4342 domain-containing protein [Anaerolineae bacterium]|nr:DUF4342 domain-containing protein [Anaerolineae bacterium]
MTDDSVPFEEEVREAGRTFTERISVTGSDLVETVQSLLREAAVRKITIQDKEGRSLLEIPLYAGVAGALILGSATVLALIAAWFAQVSILIERDKTADRGPTAVGEAVERAAGSAQSAASQVVGSVSAFFGTAAHGAGDAARKLADMLEARLNSAAGTTDSAAEKVGEMADEAAAAVGDAADAAARKVTDAAEAMAATAHDTADAAGSRAQDAAAALEDALPERQCAAITKAGTRCKRPAMDGSDFCAIHQVA